MFPRLTPSSAVLVILFATRLNGQGTTTPIPGVGSLLRPLATWNQAEREYGFAHWDAIALTRVIKRGTSVHALPAGAPLTALQPGGELAQQLDQYATDYKLAGLIILHAGSIRLERYALGHSATGRWTSFSVAKSLTSTLVGAALRDGYITSVEDPVTKYIAGLRGSAYDSVTVRQLLTMTSGVKWNEDYTDTTSDVARFYSGVPDPGVDATVSYMRKLPREAPPGQKWLYKTGETNLLGVLVSEATKKSLAAYLSEKVWASYGMEQDASWQLDRTLHEQGGCCLQATLRDFARFGQFILEGARVDGRSVVADGWLEAATRKQMSTSYADRGYGYQWWTADDGTFNAFGIHGQMIHIDRPRRLVVVMNSAWPVATGLAYAAARTKMVNAIAAAIDAESRRQE